MQVGPHAESSLCLIGDIFIVIEVYMVSLKWDITVYASTLQFDRGWDTRSAL